MCQTSGKCQEWDLVELDNDGEVPDIDMAYIIKIVWREL